MKRIKIEMVRMNITKGEAEFEKVIDLTENNIKKENEEKMEDVNKIIDDAKFEQQIKMAKNAIENNLDDDVIEKITELSKRDLKIIRIALDF